MRLPGELPGSIKDTKAFGDVLKRVVKEKRFTARARYGKLVAAWENTVGKELAKETRITNFEEGCLVIEVSSSALLQELSGFMKPTLLAELQKRDGGSEVASLDFKLGNTDR